METTNTTLTGGNSDINAQTVDCNAIGADGRRSLCARIVAHLNAGHGVAIRLYQRNVVMSGRKYARSFTVDKSGSLNVYGVGCIDFVAVSFGRVK